MAIEIKVPSLGESVAEATVAKWLKRLGEAVAIDDPVVELETDKVNIEVPAPGRSPKSWLKKAPACRSAACSAGSLIRLQPNSPA
jgi:biotin-dependent enzyme